MPRSVSGVFYLFQTQKTGRKNHSFSLPVVNLRLIPGYLYSICNINNIAFDILCNLYIAFNILKRYNIIERRNNNAYNINVLWNFNQNVL